RGVARKLRSMHSVDAPDFPLNLAPPCRMPHLSPQTLSEGETQAILAATAGHSRDHLIYSLALGTGLRLAELVGLNVGDVYAPDGTPRSRVSIRPEIAKGDRSGDIFLPDALVPKLRKFYLPLHRVTPQAYLGLSNKNLG